MLFSWAFPHKVWVHLNKILGPLLGKGSSQWGEMGLVMVPRIPVVSVMRQSRTFILSWGSCDASLSWPPVCLSEVCERGHHSRVSPQTPEGRGSTYVEERTRLIVKHWETSRSSVSQFQLPGRVLYVRNAQVWTACVCGLGLKGTEKRLEGWKKKQGK